MERKERTEEEVSVYQDNSKEVDTDPYGVFLCRCVCPSQSQPPCHCHFFSLALVVLLLLLLLIPAAALNIYMMLTVFEHERKVEDKEVNAKGERKIERKIVSEKETDSDRHCSASM